MKGLILNYYGVDYYFLLNRISVDMPNKIVNIDFDMAEPGTDVFNRSHTVMLRDRLDLAWGNISDYYRLLCVDIGVDPSIVPDDMEG